MVLQVAVIGAGAAGLNAARHLTSSPDDFSCIVFEQTGNIGGTWVYNEHVGNDEFGLPIHSSIYKSLKTNLPTLTMSYPDFPIVADEDYISAGEMLKFLQSYEDHFKLRPYIKLFHHVKNVSYVDKVWKVVVIDLKSQVETEHIFDAFLVCNGHYSKPNVPVLAGIESFQGEQIHCHDYRTPERFQDKTVVVIGAGHSSRDISLEISGVVKQLVVSHHLKTPMVNINFPSNTQQRPDIESISENAVTFKDGFRIDNVDAILYCTGYLYSFDFLDDSCRINVDDGFVQPLYKHMINIDLPTMCIVGIPFLVSPLSIFDLQVQFFLRTLTGSLQVSREEMIEDTEREMDERRAVECWSNRKAHLMGVRQQAYCHDLADMMGIPRLPAVVFDRFFRSECIVNVKQ